MELAILSHEGVGPIKFGMTPAEVRQAVGTQFRTFMKTTASEMPTDDFVGKGIHVYYKPPGFCNAVEMFSPADPMFQELKLIGRPISQVWPTITSADSTAEVDSTGLTSLAFGFGLYAPDVEESPDAPIEAAIVFEKGYYD